MPAIADNAALRPAGLLRSLHSNDAGLSRRDAAAILRTVGPNRIDAAAPERVLAALVGRFRDPPALVLFGAATVSAYLLVVFGVKRLFFNRYMVGRPLDHATQHGGHP